MEFGITGNQWFWWYWEREKDD